MKRLLVAALVLVSASLAADLSAKTYIAEVTPNVIRDVAVARDWTYMLGVRIDDSLDDATLVGYLVSVEAVHNGATYRYSTFCFRGPLWSAAMLPFPHPSAKIVSLRISRLTGSGSPVDIAQY